MRRIRIALLAGGWSGEREVSLKSGEAIYNALDKSKYDVFTYDPRDELHALMEAKEEIDLAFNLLHGKYGEDGCIQGLLDILGIPFLGSGVLSSAIAMNKKVAKDIYRKIGLRVAKEVVLRRGEDFSINEIIGILGSTSVVKPVGQGSSLGMSLCRNNEELVTGIENAFEYDEEIIIEEYVDGREVTCCVIGNQGLETLPIIEIIPETSSRFFDYKAKYTPGACREICPADLSKFIDESVRVCAKKAHQALMCSVWSRTDMIIRDEKVYVLETNTIPGMTEQSLVPLAAKTGGFSLSEFVDKMIMFSLER
jgi:D-alanine-D-alanine ligase